jgi:hypothetical protein
MRTLRSGAIPYFQIAEGKVRSESFNQLILNRAYKLRCWPPNPRGNAKHARAATAKYTSARHKVAEADLSPMLSNIWKPTLNAQRTHDQKTNRNQRQH